MLLSDCKGRNCRSARGWFRFLMWASCSAQQRPLDSQIYRQSGMLFGRELVRLDRGDAHERWPEPTSIHRASMRSRFRMWASCSAQQARRLHSRIYRQSHGLFGLWLVRRDRLDALRDGKGRNCSAARVWEAGFGLGPPLLGSRINPFESQWSRLQLTFFLYGLSFSDQWDHLVTFDKWTGPKPFLRAIRKSKIWISLERAWHMMHIFITTGDPERVLSVWNSADCLVYTIGPIGDSSSCLPEATNLNQEEQQPNRFWVDTSFQKAFEDSKFSLS